MFFSLLTSLMLAIIIEVIVAKKYIMNIKEDIRLIVLVNIFTNPLVVFFSNLILIYYSIKIYIPILIILEIITVLTEGHLYKKYLENKKIKPYKFSLILNSISFIIGIIINIILEVIM